MITYQLPDGRFVQVSYDVCRMASTIDYTLADGSVVLAVIAPRERQGRRIVCGDCNRETASYVATDRADYERANRIADKHECKEQRAANRRTARMAAVR